MNEREQALSTIRTALPVFKQINDLYLSANNLNQQVMMRQVKSADNKGKYNRIAAYGAALLCYIIMNFFYRIITRVTESGVIGLIWIILSIVLCIIVFIRTKRKINSKPVFTENEVEAQNRQIGSISNEIVRITTENQEIINSIPPDYRYYDAVAFLESVIVNGRADSMKEALNLYETHLHQERMEVNSRLTAELNRRQCAMLAGIEASAAQTERNSNIAATFSILNFLR